MSDFETHPIGTGEELKRLRVEVRRKNRLIGMMQELIAESIDTIEVFHGPDAWDIYYNNAPEMQRLRAALTPVSDGQ